MNTKISRPLSIILIAAMMLSAVPHASATRLKDVASIEGVRNNQLIGYGLVIGLAGTGDGTSNKFTTNAIMGLLQRYGLSANAQDIKAKNVASVMVQATLPPFAKPGAKVDVLVSSMGDATNMQGGTLLLTPLKAGNGQVYAVAQGPLALGGFGVASSGSSIQKNHPTVAQIPNGGLVEQGSAISLKGRTSINVLLNNPDFVTASRVAASINSEMSAEIASASDSGTIKVMIPLQHQANVVDFIAKIEAVSVFPDQRAKIILDERTGTVIMGEDVRLSTVAIAHGDLTFQISAFNTVSQAGAFAPGGQTLRVTNADATAEEEQANFTVLPGGVSLSEVVSGLNALGLSARDLISIIQAIKASGALQAEVEIR